MINFYFLLYAFISFYSGWYTEGLPHQYIIKGAIKGATNTDFVVVSYFAIDKKPDTCYLKNSYFFLKGELEEPVFATVTYNYENIPLIIENAEIHISASRSDFSNAVIKTGGVNNKILHDLFYEQQKMATQIEIAESNQLSYIEAATRKVSRRTNLKIMSLEETRKKTFLEFAKKYPDKIAPISTMLFFSNLTNWKIDSTLIEKVYNLASMEIKMSTYGRYLKHQIELADLILKHKPFFDIDGTDSAGRKINLYSINSKYTLVDFWASWCAPCRVENRKLATTYSIFKDKSFQIFSISLDAHKNDWLRAVAKDELSWINVCDFKGWNNEIVKLKFGISSVPANFLLDEGKRVVATNIKADELQAFLQKHL